MTTDEKVRALREALEEVAMYLNTVVTMGVTDGAAELLKRVRKARDSSRAPETPSRKEEAVRLLRSLAESGHTHPDAKTAGFMREACAECDAVRAFLAGHPTERRYEECWACRGYGHFSPWGKPSKEPEDRACIECGGSGRALTGSGRTDE